MRLSFLAIVFLAPALILGPFKAVTYLLMHGWQAVYGVSCICNNFGPCQGCYIPADAWQATCLSIVHSAACNCSDLGPIQGCDIPADARLASCVSRCPVALASSLGRQPYSKVPYRAAGYPWIPCMHILS